MLTKSILVLTAFAVGTSTFAAPTGKGNVRAANPAQTVAGVTPWMTMLQAGNYNFQSYDKSQIQSEFINIIRQRSEADYQYFMKSLHELDRQFKDLLKDAVYGEEGLNSLSIDSTVGQKPVDGIVLAKAQAKYKENRLALQNRIELMASISDSFPSQQVSAEQSGVANIPNYGNMDFSKVTGPVLAKLEQMDKMVSNLGFMVAFESDKGNPPKVVAANSGKGLDPVAPSLKVPMEVIQQKRNEINDLRTKSVETAKAIRGSHTWLVQMIRGFMQTYGAEEKWRMRNEKDLKDREVKWQEIVEIFFHRSYLRMAYGVPLCVVGIPYEKSALKLDVITTTAQDLARTISEPICLQNEFQRIRTNYTNALLRADARSKKILASIMNGQIGPIQVVENLTTFMTGNRSLAEAVNMMLMLMAADFYEEEVLMQTGGMAKMNLRFKERFMNTDTTKTLYTKLAQEFDPEAFGLEGEQTTMSAGSERAVFANLLVQTKFENDRLQRAKELEAFVRVASGADENSANKSTKKRVNDMFGN